MLEKINGNKNDLVVDVKVFGDVENVDNKGKLSYFMILKFFDVLGLFD